MEGEREKEKSGKKDEGEYFWVRFRLEHFQAAPA